MSLSRSLIPFITALSKAFFEKYDCNKLGFTGAGGEYAPQTGFGWTNGAILSFILKYGDDLMKDYDHEHGLSTILKLLEQRTRDPPMRNTPEDVKPLSEMEVLQTQAKNKMLIENDENESDENVNNAIIDLPEGKQGITVE